MKKARRTKKTKLPASFRPFFWSYRFQDLDPHEDVELIIKQLVLFGNLPEWRWMIQRYGKRKIVGVLSRTPESELRPSSVELVKTVFDIHSMPYVRCLPH